VFADVVAAVVVAVLLVTSGSTHSPIYHTWQSGGGGVAVARRIPYIYLASLIYERIRKRKSCGKGYEEINKFL